MSTAPLSVEIRPVRIGTFRFERPIAAGGFGAIWKGVHEPSALPVAIKVLTHRTARDQAYYEDFRAEVQAVARLSHPAIIDVFEYGTMPAHAHELTEGRLVEGSPYLVMALAQGGSLDAQLGQITWSRARHVLETTLEGLAHANARGLVHRDLKPANILLFSAPSDARWKLKLTDFGLVHRTDDEMRTDSGDVVSRDTIIGTPAYMAPEQLEGRWRDYGPATDLYALGMMAYQLVSGEPPFVDESSLKLAMKHLTEPLPDLTPIVAVPAGFEAWIARLTCKGTHERYRSAAEALWVLRALCEGFDPPDDPPRSGSHLSTELLDSATKRADNGPSIVVVREKLHGTSRAVPHVEQLQPPSSWTELPERPAPRMLLGAGMGLYGIRTIPVVGRRRERDCLWRRLRALHDERHGGAIVLRGASGTGKSRLAEWLLTAAQESGSASALVARHDADGGPLQGLISLVSRWFRTRGQSEKKARRRVRRLLRRLDTDSDFDVDALVDLLGPSLTTRDDGEERASEHTAQVRFAVVWRLLRTAAESHPLLIWLDDVHHSADSLAFVRYALRDAENSGVLFVLTAQTEALAERPALASEISSILADDHAEDVPLGPLDPMTTSALVEKLLHLSGELADQVTRRVAGNPLFAVQLVGDWIDRKLLEPTDQGFRLRAGERIRLPDTLHEVWAERIRVALEGLGEDAAQALELAAVLGQEVLDGELDDALARAELTLPDALLDRLEVRGMVVREARQRGWTFQHALVRESLLNSAEAHDRRKRWHAVCAEALEQRYGMENAATAERLARHLVGAGRHADSIVPLTVAAGYRIKLGAYAEGLVLLDELEGVTRHDPDARVRGGVLRAQLHLRQWQLEEAWTTAQATLEQAERNGLDAERAELLAILGNVARLRGEPAAAARLSYQAVGIYDVLDDESGKATALRAVAALEREQARFDVAIRCYRKAMELFEHAGKRSDVVDCLYGLGNLFRQRSRYDQALEHYEAARRLAASLGNIHQQAEATNGIAEIARYQGRLDDAEPMYREALEQMRRVGARDAIVPQLNLGLTEILRENFDVALEVLDDAIPTLEREGKRVFLTWAHVHRLPCLAATKRLHDWDVAYRSTLELLRETGLLDTDVGEAAELTARIFTDQGETDRKRAMLLTAHQQWRGLDNRERAVQVSAALAERD